MSCCKKRSDDSRGKICGWRGVGGEWGVGILLKWEIESCGQMGHLQIVLIFPLCLAGPYPTQDSRKRQNQK